jgi:hypothetical protein
LQEAIEGASGETLILCAGTWTLSSTVVIGKDLTLIGAGAGQTVLDGRNAVQVLQIAAGAEVTVQDLTITKGQASGDGGGIYNEGMLTLIGVSMTGNAAVYGGGLYNQRGSLTLEDGTVIGGGAGEGNTASFVGGIYNNGGTLTLQSGSRVTGNTSLSLGGGILNANSGTVTLQSGSSVTGNESREGGGIYNTGGTLTLQLGSRVTGNRATTDGGGILNRNLGTLRLQSGSRVTGNSATRIGGGIVNEDGTATVDDGAIICGNTQAQGGQCNGTLLGDGRCPNPRNGICLS